MNEGYMFYEIKEHIATLSEKSDGRFTIEHNIFNFRGKNDKYDLRRWDKENVKRYFPGKRRNNYIKRYIK